MRPLAPSLTAAQKACNRVPALSVTATDKLAGVARLHWERVYSGAEADFYHGAVIAGDGALVRLRVGPSADNNRLYRQRILNPGAESDFSQWQNTGIYDCRAVAVVSHGAEVNIFWVDADQSIKRIQSTNCGSSWGSSQTIDYSPDTVTGSMAAACKGNGDLAVFFVAGNTLYMKRRTGVVWQSLTTWDKTTGTLTSVAAVYDGGWNIVVTGQDESGNFKVWSLIFNDVAGAWSELREIATAPADGLYEYRSAFLSKTDVFRVFYVEKYLGEEPYSRVYRTEIVADTLITDTLWREPVPFDYECEYGLALISSNEYAWLTAPGAIWKAALRSNAIDLSDDVQWVECETGLGAGALTVEINNAEGKYRAGAEMPDMGWQLEISPGYTVNGNKENSPGMAFWLESLEYVYSESKARVVFRGIDGWGLLSNWHARQQFRWNKDGNQAAVKELLAFVLGRVGLKMTVISQSDTAATFYPDFTLHPGDSGISAVNRLLSFVPDRLVMEGHHAYFVNPTADDEAVYEYGKQHVIYGGQYRRKAGENSSVHVEGYTENGSLSAEVFNWQELEQFPDRYQAVSDRNILTAEQAQNRGQAISRKAELAAITGVIRVPVNCGQQVNDVILVHEPKAGLAGVKKRVNGIILTYQPERAVYEQKLKLGGV